jgi:hypothetical protein
MHGEYNIKLETKFVIYLRFKLRSVTSEFNFVPEGSRYVKISTCKCKVVI